jgi:ECF transporter S component (folate family)
MRKKYELRALIVLALFTAIGAALKAFVSLDLFFGSIKISDISLAALPVMMAGIYYGPLAGGLVGFVSEMLSYFLMPAGGAYNPAFSAVMALSGVIAGLFYLKTQRSGWTRTIIMVVVSEMICSGALTTLLVHAFYGVPLIALLPGRGIGLLIKIPFLIVLLMALVERLRPMVVRRRTTAVAEN